MFRTELHCHSNDASPCGKESAETLVDIYSSAGYDSIVLTNHFNRDCFETYKCNSWQEYVDLFMNAYEKLKRAAEGKLTVILGAELRFTKNYNDYLWIGANEEFMRNNPTMFEMKPAQFHEICQENGWLFVQAHPFRNHMTVVKPCHLDGVEVYNGHIGHESRNFLAEAWAEEYSLIKTSGTDLHEREVPPTGGILTEEKICSSDQLVRILKSGSYTLLKSDKAR